MKYLAKQAVQSAVLLALFAAAAPAAYAAGTVAPSHSAFNMAIAYGVTSAAALLLAIGYWGFVKKKNPWLQLLFLSVVLVNFGYFALAISKTLEEALLANRISYLGSVFLPLCIFMTIMDVCRIRYTKKFPAALFFIGAAVFLLAASPGYLDYYYSDVSLVFVNGMATLVKVYGPLHILYHIYLLSYMGLMTAAILASRIKRKTVSQKHAILLMVVAFLNIAIWAVEQLIYTEFELLSVSYIISELLLLLLYGMMQDYGIVPDKAYVSVPVAATDESHTAGVEEEPPAGLVAERILALSARWTQEYALTARETEVLISLLENKRRKEIALDMNITEHTVKKHTGNIFSKLGVSNRAELFALADQA